jgi:hypothetical protein
MVTACYAAAHIYDDGLFDRTFPGSWEPDANRRPLKDVLDARAVFRAAQHDPPAPIGTLQVPIGWTIREPVRYAKTTHVGNQNRRYFDQGEFPAGLPGVTVRRYLLV